jgi:hypothetical protein
MLCQAKLGQRVALSLRKGYCWVLFTTYMLSLRRAPFPVSMAIANQQFYILASEWHQLKAPVTASFVNHCETNWPNDALSGAR